MPTPAFPVWIDRHKGAKRAALRLKYMLNAATLPVFGSTSIHELARRCACSHAAIFNAIARGWFTKDMAQAIETCVGRERLEWEWLVLPLDVGTHETTENT